MHWYFDVMTRYTEFGGRASRQEYWMFVLASLIASLVLEFVLALALEITGMALHINDVSHTVALMYDLVVLLPSLAVAVRRVHDTDRAGWWLLVPLVSLLPGTPGDNRFGPPPVSRGSRRANATQVVVAG
jgi:uncharacterized membrane protein YhaH (DUF805 family)